MLSGTNRTSGSNLKKSGIILNFGSTLLVKYRDESKWSRMAKKCRFYTRNTEYGNEM